MKLGAFLMPSHPPERGIGEGITKAPSFKPCPP